MLDKDSFAIALRVFNRTRSNAVECLRAAIEAFRMEEIKHVHKHDGLTFYIVGTDSGPDTALVITGFNNAEGIDRFITGVVRASRK